MDRIKTLSSPQNPVIKHLLTLQRKSRERRKTGHFVLEGIRELTLAVQGGYQMESVFYSPDIVPYDAFSPLLKTQVSDVGIFSVTKTLYAKIAQRGTTEGVLAIAIGHDHGLETFIPKATNPLILVSEAPEKPGNIGAMLRTADAAGLDGMIIANPRTDLYNPNIIRSSVGCVFTVPVAMGTSNGVRAFLNQRKIPYYCAALITSSQRYDRVDYTGACAIVVGTEADGLESQWLDSSRGNIVIPMAGSIDSLNVSVSAAILIFEANRQRGFPNGVTSGQS